MQEATVETEVKERRNKKKKREGRKEGKKDRLNDDEAKLSHKREGER